MNLSGAGKDGPVIYKFDLSSLPAVSECAAFTRNTTWRCADGRNILIFVEEGSVAFLMNGEEYLLGPGDFLLIPAHTPFVRKPVGGGDYTFVSTHFTTKIPPVLLTPEQFSADAEKIRDDRLRRYFARAEDGEPAEDDLQRSVWLPATVQIGDRFGQASDILRRIRQEEIGRVHFYDRIAPALSFAELLLLISDAVISDFRLSESEDGRDIPASLAQVLYYIQKNYNRPLSVPELAAQIAVTDQHVIRLFRENLGTTPVRYINRVRVLHAIELLRHTDLTVKQIAYELGFEDPNYFCRVFKKEEKMTPLETRRRIMNFETDRVASPVRE